MAGGQNSWGSSTLENLAANRVDRLSGVTLGGGATLGAWTGGAGRDNSGVFNDKLLCWILSVGHPTIKPFLVTLVVSLGSVLGVVGILVVGLAGFEGNLYSLLEMQQISRFW